MKQSYLTPILVVVMICLFTPTSSLPFAPNQTEVGDTSRIVGGSNAPDVPYMVSLRRWELFRWVHFCGGAIISDQWIVTVASCFDDGLGLLPRVFVGSNSLLWGGSSYPIAQVKIASSYVPATRRFNFALVQIEGSFSFGTKVQKIAVPNVPIPVPTSCTLTGWGATSPWGLLQPFLLQKIDGVRTMSYDDCYKALKDEQYVVGSATICADPGQDRGACGEGEMGSPLVHDGGLVGLFSWGVTPCAQNKPDVYTFVGIFRLWIETETGVIL